MIAIVFGTVLPWLLIAVGSWLAYPVVRQPVATAGRKRLLTFAPYQSHDLPEL